MAQTSINKIFSSKLIQDAAQGMGLVEGKAFGAQEDPNRSLKVSEFLEIYKENKAGDKQHGWNEVTLRALAELTRSMTMESLVGFFAELEQHLDEDEFAEFFQVHGVNNARYQHVLLLASVNVIFNPSFKKRLMKTLEISKGWWSE